MLLKRQNYKNYQDSIDDISFIIQVKKMSNNFASRLVEAYKAYIGGKLISIVLFGSRARGDHTESSDFDGDLTGVV